MPAPRKRACLKRMPYAHCLWAGWRPGLIRARCGWAWCPAALPGVAHPPVLSHQAKTHEKVDSIGEERSIACHAVVMLIRKDMM